MFVRAYQQRGKPRRGCQGILFLSRQHADALVRWHGEVPGRVYWRDLILFYEYFHGDNGAGLGASHQTGWTGLIAPLLDLFGRLEAKSFLETDRGQILARLITEQVGGEER